MLAAAVASSGCGRREPVRSADASTADSLARAAATRAHRDSIVRSRPGYIVDSILPTDEDIRRFQATLLERPTQLDGGAPSRTALVSQFIRALERNDTTALDRLVVTRGEFGYLIYPTSPNAVPPYRQSPQIVWLSRSASTHKGMSRLLARFGGKSVPFAGYTCPESATHEGSNTVWARCAVKLARTATDTSTLRMFGGIVAREGRYKFLSLANGL
jgi:hypothetical protein